MGVRDPFNQIGFAVATSTGNLWMFSTIPYILPFGDYLLSRAVRSVCALGTKSSIANFLNYVFLHPFTVHVTAYSCSWFATWDNPYNGYRVKRSEYFTIIYF